LPVVANIGVLFRRLFMTPGKNRRTIFGAIEFASGRWCYQVACKASSATFTAFLEYLLVAYLEGVAANSPTLAIEGRIR
jgi:hypothetical protein